MPEVHADPEKLKQLAKSLTKSADQLQEVARGLSRALESSGWQDSERQKFEQDFKQTVKSLSQFTDKLRGQYAPVLQKKAAALEQYRGR
ncbi:WXG100 family type VII secretion target [Blastococcus sp. SYSU DS0616]